jgi:hypothetical protein
VIELNSRINAICFVKAYPFLDRERSTSPMKSSPLWTMAINDLLKGRGALMRTAVVATAICLSIVGIASADEARAAVRKTTHIQAEGLGPALTTLAKDFDFQVLYRTETVGQLRTQGVAGLMTATEALEHVLNGTGLTYRYLDDKTVTILPVGAGFSEEQSGTLQATSGDPAAKEGKKNSSEGFRLAQVDQGTNSQSSTVENNPLAPQIVPRPS